MKIVTINIPDQYLDCMKTMIDIGIYPNRSEAVREALKLFLRKEKELNKDLDPERFRELKEHQLDQLSHFQ